jgi:excisionase family DNA binding protein
MSINTLTSKDVMEILGISRQTLCQWIKKRKLKGYKVGRRWIFKEDEVLSLMEDNSNPLDEKIYSDILLKRKAVVDKILSKSIKMKGLTSADLVRIGREERETKIG